MKDTGAIFSQNKVELKTQLLEFIDREDLLEMNRATASIIRNKTSKKLSEKLEKLDIHVVCMQIIEVLKEIVKENESLIENNVIQMTNPKEDPFYSEIIPKMSLEDYLKRIINYTKMEVSTLVLVGIFIDKLCETSHLYITQNTLYR